MSINLKEGQKLYKTFLKKKEISDKNNTAYNNLLHSSYRETQYALRKANNSFAKLQEAKETWFLWLSANGNTMLEKLLECEKYH